MSNHPLGFELVGNHERMRLLDELKRVAVGQLGNLPGELFAPIETRLQEAIRQGGGAQERLDLAALLALRARGAGFVMRYRELLARNFDDLRNRAGRDAHVAAMGLVEESDLEFHVAGQQVADAVARQFARPLELLEQRFELLCVSIGAPNRRTRSVRCAWSARSSRPSSAPNCPTACGACCSPNTNADCWITSASSTPGSTD